MSGRWLARALRAFWYALLLFLYAPLAVVVVFSFNSINSSARFSGFSLQWYERLFANEIIMQALWNTIVLALVSTLIAVMIGSMLG